MAQASLGRTTDDLFLKSIIDTIDEGYESILVIGTTKPFMDTIRGCVISQRDPLGVTTNSLRWENGQRVLLYNGADNSRLAGIYADRVLVHPLADWRARTAAISREKPQPRKVDTPCRLND